MAHKTYTYNYASFLAGIDPGRLKQDIQSAGFETALDGINIIGAQDVYITFRSPLSGNEKNLLDGSSDQEENQPFGAGSVLAKHSGKPLTDTSVSLTSAVKPEIPEVWFHTVNWCDKTTWYPYSQRVVGEVLTPADVDEHTDYSMHHRFLIDLVHGKLPDEDVIAPAYAVNVYVNGDKKQEDKPLAFENGKRDYRLDYSSGQVHFHEPLQPADVVTADYSWAKQSLYVICPKPGKTIDIQSAEAEFTTDFDMRDTVYYQGFIYAAAAMAEANIPDIAMLQAALVAQFGSIEALNTLVGKFDENGDPTSDDLTLLDKVPVGERRVYKTYWDFKAQSNGNYAALPPVGGPLRGVRASSITHPFDYKGAKILRSEWGAEARVWLESNIQFGGGQGARATATFYTLSRDSEL